MGLEGHRDIDIHRGSGHRARQNLHLRLDWVQCVNS